MNLLKYLPEEEVYEGTPIPGRMSGMEADWCRGFNAC